MFAKGCKHVSPRTVTSPPNISTNLKWCTAADPLFGTSLGGFASASASVHALPYRRYARPTYRSS